MHGSIISCKFAAEIKNNIVMKAKVIFPYDEESRKEREFFNSISSDVMELEMSETSICEYKLKFKQVGNGMNVWIEETCNNGEIVSNSKNLDCLCRKVILAEKIINSIKTNAFRATPFFDNSNQTEDDKNVANALECAMNVVNAYIDGQYFDFKHEDLELICKAAAYKKQTKQQ